LINAQFRTAIIGLDNTIQFVVDNKNNTSPDPDLSRRMHAASLDDIGKYVSAKRHLFVGSYDEFLGGIHVLVNFNGPWMDCTILYGQPVGCKLAIGKQ
jgi:hypothetical protein